MIPKADAYESTKYSVAEVTCGIVCGCLPALPSFIRHVSDVKIRLMKTSHDRSQSTFSSWNPNTRQPVPKSPSSPGRPIVLSPLSKTSPVYSTMKAISPTTSSRKDGGGSRHHRWEELDELEYVAGDDKRYATMESSTAEPQPPPSILKREERIL